jgi:phosphotransferase system IIB component
MLLNEFLKEHGKVQDLEATITRLKSMVEKQQAANAQQQKQIEAVTAGLQKVSAQVEISRPAPQVVDNQ